MLENMALVSLPGTVNAGLCGKATFGFNERCGMNVTTFSFNNDVLK